MLLVSGTIKGTHYDEKPVQASLLIDAFNIPPMNGAPKVFKLIEGTSAMRKDRSNPGEILVSPGQMLGPQYSVNTPEGTLSIRFYSSRQVIPGGAGTYRYTPKKVTFIRGESKFYFTPDRIDEYVWAYLHPNCYQSPFKKSNRPSVYSYHDPEEQARIETAFTAKKMELMQVIMLGLGEQELRTRAAGLTYMFNNRRISFSNAANPKISVSIVKNNLINALNAHEQRFIDAWNSSEGSVVGVVKMAESLGIIEQHPTSLGTEWRFHQNYGGARICTATKDQDSLSVLVGEVTGQYNHYMTKLKGLIDVASGGTAVIEEVAPKVIEKEVIKEVVKEVEKIVYRDAAPTGPLSKTEIDELANLDFVEYCEKRDIIALDRAKNQVCKLNKKGAIERPIVKVESLNKWREEFAAYLNEDEGKLDRTDLTVALIKLKE